MAKKTVKKAAAKKAVKKAPAKKAVKKAAKTTKQKAITVTAKVSGGKLQTIEASTLGELKTKLGVPTYQATVDGEPQNDKAFALEQDSMVMLTAPVKGS